jgi:hypothetical protein
MHPNAGPIGRALHWCAVVLTILALCAPHPARADVLPADLPPLPPLAPSPGEDPVKCGPETPFGILCAEVSFTRYATSPGTATITTLFSNPSFPPAVPVTATEAAIALTSPQVGSAAASVSFLNESKGIIGADISIPHAFWIHQELWCWPNCTTPIGALAIFNSIGSPPIGYANALIIGDPPPSISISEIEAAVTSLGGAPSSYTLKNTLTISLTGSVTPPTLPTLMESPEPSYVAVLAMVGLVCALWQRRRSRRVRDGA